LAKYPALDLRFAPGPGAGGLQDLLYAELDPFEPIAIQENEAGDSWRVFFRTAGGRGAARRALLSEFRNALDVSPVDVDDEDWARRSQAALKAVRVGRLIVAPPWALTLPGSGVRDPGPETDIVIVIEPSMGFGTGHHATTRLCLELLQQITIVGKSVLDVGTGSGVLAIAAAKLGASRVVGIDIDPDALQNARENVHRNAVQDIVRLSESDTSASLEPADIVLANLTAADLQRTAADVRRLTAPHGTLVVSGFAPDDVDVLRALGAVEIDHRVDGEWMAAALRTAP
jgi:ribosomal protein L11 methyltransferase